MRPALVEWSAIAAGGALIGAGIAREGVPFGVAGVALEAAAGLVVGAAIAAAIGRRRTRRLDRRLAELYRDAYRELGPELDRFNATDRLRRP